MFNLLVLTLMVIAVWCLVNVAIIGIFVIREHLCERYFGKDNWNEMMDQYMFYAEDFADGQMKLSKDVAAGLWMYVVVRDSWLNRDKYMAILKDGR